MANLIVLAVALSIAAPSLLSSFSISQFGFESPLWNTACILACWVIGLLTYHIVLYPIFFTPFKHLPVPAGRSFWNGHFAQLLKPYEGQVLAEWAKAFPNNSVIRFYSLFNKEILLVTTDKAVADVLVNKDDDFDKVPPMAYAMRKIAGFGIFLARGEEHKAQRKSLSPAFSNRSIKALHPLFWWGGMAMVKGMQESTEKLPEDKRIVRLKDWSSRVTLDIMGRAAIGLEFGTIKEPKNRLHEEYRRIFEDIGGIGDIIAIMAGEFFPSLLDWLPTQREQAIGSGDSYIESLARDLLRGKKKKMAEGSNDSTDMISICMNNGDFSDVYLTQQLRSLLAAGHETTASTFLWCVYALCKFPEWQQRLRHEVRSQIPCPDPSDPSFAPSLDSLHNLRAFCNEVLRFYPPVPQTPRLAINDTVVDDIFIPKGTEIHIGHEALNHSKKYWGPDAEQFNPERWLAPGCANTGGVTTNFAYMTFAHGPHNCIGVSFTKAEMEILLAIMVGTFEMEFADPHAKLERVGFATLRPKDGVPVKLKVIEGW